MEKIKLTKNEQKKQKDQLKRFQRYLPTLLLKKQLLQMEIRQVEAQIAQKQRGREQALEDLCCWVDVFAEGIDLAPLVQVEEVRLETVNIAGLDVPVFKGLRFEDIAYDLMEYPLWVDAGVQKLKELAAFDVELSILKRQAELLEAELRTTSQRVNLFEKVKIPETKENIRVINIFLGDQQTAAVVRGKISKSKLVRGTG